MKDKTLERTQKYLQLAKFFSGWSKDPRTRVGAVIIGTNGQVLAQGYNGFPRGILDSEERLNNRETKGELVVHAESNALYNALYNGASIQGSTIYVYGLHVCHECAKSIIQSGIKKVVMHQSIRRDNWLNSTNLAKDLFREAGVEYEVVSELHKSKTFK